MLDGPAKGPFARMAIEASMNLSIDWNFPLFLPYGVTTIADLHNDTAWGLAQREALKSGLIKGPRLFISGARMDL